MICVEKIHISKEHSDFSECERVCTLSRVVYNQALYQIRQHYFNTKKYIGLFPLNKIFQKLSEYQLLPTKVAKMTLRKADKNFISFFGLLKKGLKCNIPNYINSKNGRFVTEYYMEAISRDKENKKNGILKLSQTSIEIHTKIPFEKIKGVRIVPENNGNKSTCKAYKIEILYERDCKPKKTGNRIMSLDLGIKNLATVVNNYDNKSFIINGLPLVYIINVYEKLKAKRGKHLVKLNRNKRLKIHDYLHKCSRYLVNQAVSNNIDTVVVGYNKNWKQDIKLGKKNNQKFGQIPHRTFLNQLKYKLELEGITYIEVNESYTSKCSFIDNEEMKKKKEYDGKRISRGLFRTKEGVIINADLNGAYNILRKYDSTFKFDENLFSTNRKTRSFDQKAESFDEKVFSKAKSDGIGGLTVAPSCRYTPK